MKSMPTYRSASILVIIIAVVIILVYGKPFLVPLVTAAVLSMLLLPVSRWMQSKGIPKAVSILLSLLLLPAFLVLVGLFIGWQLEDILSNTEKLEEQFKKYYNDATSFIANRFGVTKEEQQKMMQRRQASGSGLVTSILQGLGGFLANSLLVLVYIFLFLYFRERLKSFIVRLVPAAERPNAMDTIDKVQQVAQKYMTGLFLMIVCLWVMYGIGFSIIGVKNALFFAIVCGLLEIVPFIGNLTGTALTLLMSLVQGGGTGLIIGILIIYASVQFIQSYLLEPLIVGAEVDINPLFTIVGLIAGEVLWGIPGMILAIPVLGMIKIVCDHVEPLKPFGYLIGQEKKKSKLKEKFKKFFSAKLLAIL